MASRPDLKTDDGLRAALEMLGEPDDGRKRWMHEVAETISWVRGSTKSQRETEEFQHRLWEENNIAALGQGNISVEEPLKDPSFRLWFAERSMAPLPPAYVDRDAFLSAFYDDVQGRLDPFVRSTPKLKIFRVMAALFPQAMTTVASSSHLRKLAKAMGGSEKLTPVQRHLFVRQRLQDVLGKVDDDPGRLANRMSIGWLLYSEFVATPDAPEPLELEPLPAIRRRRGLTPTKGLFPGLISALDFVRPGVTREELLDFLRGVSPDAKAASLGVSINVFQSELGAIRREDEEYVLTEAGRKALDAQSADPLAPWILTRVLGPDKALLELRERGSTTLPELVAIVRSMNPSLASNFVPQAVVSWLRSFGVLEVRPSGDVSLTKKGKEWADQITWTPETLPADQQLTQVTGANRPPASIVISLPPLAEAIKTIQSRGEFGHRLISELHAGVWCHPRRHFAILTGLSGSGKTLLALSYADAITGSAQERIFTLAVQPGWYDPGAILGYSNPLVDDSYVTTPFLDFLISASQDPGHPYVAILDEMNLSHPEQYMSPLLSAMETGGSIQIHANSEGIDGVPPSIEYPANLVLLGTTNMDETTHGLSDKILDRAFVLEFWDVDLNTYPRWGTRNLKVEYEQRARNVLADLMVALAPARMHFGWRVVDDILEYLSRIAIDSQLTFSEALDSAVYAKILPKLRGDDSPRFREALNKCSGILSNDVFPRSAGKLSELVLDLETTGSARFWR